MTLAAARAALRAHANPEHAAFHQRFFKTGPGEYGEGDRFLGVRVPPVRAVARQYRDLRRPDVRKLLRSKWHEERLLALIILTHQFQRMDRAGEDEAAAELVDFYLDHTEFINNWDLVDASAHKILGTYLLDRPRKILDELSRSPSLWERRIAMIATMPFVGVGELEDTLRLAKRYLQDPEDLMHKATGWLLREVGKQQKTALTGFLDEHYPRMPRTMLRYAIEKLPEPMRQAYLQGKR